MNIFFLLTLGTLFFLIWGIVSFLRWLAGGNQEGRIISEQIISNEPANPTISSINREKIFIEELKKIINESPDKTVTEVYQEYLHQQTEKQAHLQDIKQLAASKEYRSTPLTTYSTQENTLSQNPTTAPIIQNLINTPAQVVDSQNIEPQPTIEDLWSNWYSENSINLLLYIGAFFIVASASIFVGFQWESIDGVLKASLLSFLTIAFFTCGLLFYKNSKIKNAGTIFTGIGALLIPFCGAGWYNFVFISTDINFGWVWLFTSIIAITTYLYLAYFFKNKYYTYIASISSISFLLAMVKTAGLNADFYILASILASYILMINSFFIKPSSAETKEVFITPLQISANITMPLTLIFGLFTAASTNKLFSIEASLSVGIAALYYLMLYLNFKKFSYLVTAVILYPCSLLFYTIWMQFPTPFILYLVSATAFFDLSLAKYYQDQDKAKESDLFVYTAIIKITIVAMVAWVVDVATIHKITISLIVCATSLYLLYIKKIPSILYFSTISLAVGLILFTTNYLPFIPQYTPTVIGFIVIGTIFYFLRYKASNQYKEIWTISALIYFAIALVYAVSNQSLLALTTTCFVVLGLHAYIQTKQIVSLYIAAISGLVAIPNLIYLYSPQNYYQSLLLSVHLTIVVILYLIVHRLTKEATTRIHYAAIITIYLSALLIYTVTSHIHLAITALTITLLACHAAYKFSESKLIFVGLLFFPLATHQIISLMNPIHFNQVLTISYLLTSIALFIVLIKFNSSSEFTKVYAISTALYFLLTLLVALPSQQLLIITCAIITIIAFYATLHFDEPPLTYISAVALIATTYLATDIYIPYIYQQSYRVLVFLLMSLSLYYILITQNENKKYITVLAINTGIFMFLLFISSFSSDLLQSISAVTIALILVHAAYKFDYISLGYASNVFFFFAFLSLFSYVQVSPQAYPIYLSSLTVLLYCVKFVTPQKLEQMYRNTGLTMILAIPLYYGILSTGEVSDLNTISSPLISAYIATALFGLDAYLKNTLRQKYITSVIGTLTYLWQIKQLGYTEPQLYTLPLGIYFLIIGYIEKLHERYDNYTLLDNIGIGFIIIPTILQSFGINGVYYTLLAIMEGILFVTGGITLKYKNYLYIGTATLIGATLIRTYEYLFQLPWWLVTALIGGTFLSLAIYLMLHKKE